MPGFRLKVLGPGRTVPLCFIYITINEMDDASQFNCNRLVPSLLESCQIGHLHHTVPLTPRTEIVCSRDYQGCPKPYSNGVRTFRGSSCLLGILGTFRLFSQTLMYHCPGKIRKSPGGGSLFLRPHRMTPETGNLQTTPRTTDFFVYNTPFVCLKRNRSIRQLTMKF